MGIFTPPLFLCIFDKGGVFSGGVKIIMANVCPVCDKPIGAFKRIPLKDGIVCNSCFIKAGLAGAFHSKLVEVWEVVTLCDMSEEEKRQHIEKKRQKLQDERMSEIQQKIRENNVPVKQVDNTPRCPKCGSTSISANQKGFGVGKAVIGAAVAGPIGLVAGNAGAKKVFITCLNCGHRWQAGKAK